MKIVEILRNKNRTLLEMHIGIVFWGLVCQEQPENLLVVVGSIYNEKPQLTISVSNDLVERGINAGKIVGQAAREMQGGGGGQAHFAQAGGKNPAGVRAAIDKVFEIIEG